MAAKKRTPDQIKHDRARMAELVLMQHTDAEIAKILGKETGLQLTRRQINYDRNKIRQAWQKVQHDNYDLLMTTELARLDVLERSIWEALRSQMQPRKREEIERILPRGATIEDDEEAELIISKLKTVVEDTAVNASYFAQIADCQKERRKLLGLYAPQVIGVNKVVTVKGYAEVSPQDWPSVIEGEVIKTE